MVEQLTDEVALHARSSARVELLQSQLQDAHDALLELEKWYNDGVCTWEPHCPAELATIWRRAASVRQRIQEGIRCGTDN
ncbi:hypothetical protein M5X05_30455 [Paenibacillus alvei]|uniref:hypothetical protein n=1 Tax=Paenibacillus alvei TaxID=44250 RepID=UPI002284EF80|nr:hypothetical protein [Paenibacillus alvei]MCY9708487.1 hypothetical protein [Paenibacillus alvei]